MSAIARQDGLTMPPLRRDEATQPVDPIVLAALDVSVKGAQFMCSRYSVCGESLAYAILANYDAIREWFLTTGDADVQ
ncbi:hypothetical protein HYH03_016194 [Edaphochlamys debaryana]|uniref:Uncharacterized protein n=1 Tax=Edaphochlamys debaryana TaxID=47281 RepID=A0A836BQJ6_9CHLO|nr:hypothetical protein HYH03_016194 [Edaphochlamys debaryana]|eukprot:KAG2485097.1 hypothetical protein HYH03_016194 [Edaphochlamys debaryana]